MASVLHPHSVEEIPMDEDVTKNPPRAIRARFELVAGRIADAWISSGKLHVSGADLRLAQEFLEQTGYTVQEIPGLLVRLTHHDGRSEEMTREKAVLLAMRRLANVTAE
jgi:hypothetical protein